ncbi:hypothetical protein BRADI_2g61696v3 [Brachypodium distachyon]|uniref:Uncharacterized protein n=1 Tax=Brachypodium distachyon TaxID=15368 RepID=A0A0Q3J165_BRADI|nr:hypothetical protein BRADI_2g61696v3 [Brachypodium distachyon]
MSCLRISSARNRLSIISGVLCFFSLSKLVYPPYVWLQQKFQRKDIYPSNLFIRIHLKLIYKLRITYLRSKL